MPTPLPPHRWGPHLLLTKKTTSGAASVRLFPHTHKVKLGIRLKKREPEPFSKAFRTSLQVRNPSFGKGLAVILF